jgi:hypothetical protein
MGRMDAAVPCDNCVGLAADTAGSGYVVKLSRTADKRWFGSCERS